MLTELLAERMSISEAIGRIKERSGLTVLQTGRWEAVLTVRNDNPPSRPDSTPPPAILLRSCKHHTDRMQTDT